MPTYAYKIVLADGSQQSGKIEAESLTEAVTKIKQPKSLILKMKLARWQILAALKKKPRFSRVERIIFTEHMGSMIKSGTPIVEALETYVEEDKNRSTPMIESIIKDIQNGKPVAYAFGRYPDVFSSLYLALIHSGEISGNLEESLAYLATDLRREHEFLERIKSAMMYPVVVLMVAFVVISGLVIFVIPRLTQITENFGTDMPLSTRIVTQVSDWLSRYGVGLMIGQVIMGFGLVLAFRRPSIKTKLEPYLLRLPLIGLIIKKYMMARFLRTLGGCLENGIPLLQALDTVTGVVSNGTYQAGCKRIKISISKGLSLTEAIGQEKFLFPPVVKRMAKGAEKTGTLSAALFRMSEMYEDEIDRDLKRVTALIEPAMIVVLGVIVGAIAIAVIAPIYQLTSKIK